ncbi:hypothetical protein EB796_016686 [Bugula neritina]|uniref:Uncharacterized protein n=1 Tax=Bugula neritina TaxID=10212 RepID=A0A7J7JFW8_BUGNE|nr:hypothetical protein EB796_016686 [Bugula neritina]
MFYSVEGEFIPIKGDEVTFQKILIPPKNESYQAVHVKITHLKEGEIHHDGMDQLCNNFCNFSALPQNLLSSEMH